MDENHFRFIELLKRDHRFGIESYRFVNEALEYAQKSDKCEKKIGSKSFPVPEISPAKEVMHVSGQNLCHAVRDYAISQYGLMARHVVTNLGIRKTGDVGEIVYNLIGIGWMNKTEEDSREDFDNVFDLIREIEEGFRFNGSKKKTK